MEAAAAAPGPGAELCVFFVDKDPGLSNQSKGLAKRAKKIGIEPDNVACGPRAACPRPVPRTRRASRLLASSR